MEIRMAKEADIPTLVDIHVTTWRETYEDIFTDPDFQWPTIETREAQWRQRFSSAANGWFCFVAEVDGRVVGFAVGRRKAWRDFEGELDKIYILREFQRRGIGRRLMAAVAERFLDGGLESMWLFAHPRNPSCAFYEVLGAEKAYEDEDGVIYAWRSLV